MEITFKNTVSTTKGKQCEEFLSILKKLKFMLSTKDRQLSFYVSKYFMKIRQESKEVYDNNFLQS
jgi:hypothetical protein